MAKKISQLTQATQVKSDDVTVIVQDGETKKLPLNMMVTKQDIENKKVAGLAKLDEIEATYENDTYTPTIAVKNKSSVKVGEGDGVDYSANVMDGHVKSAILTGNTLVNLISNDEIYYQKSPTENWDDYPNGINTQRCSVYIKNIKPNTRYLIKTLSETKEFYIRFFNETTTSNGSTGWRNINSIFTTLSDTNKISISFRLSNKNENYTDVSQCSNILLLEYQDGIENWDIPYFEGMKSVKMPVLTTTGKNLFDKNNVMKDKYISGAGKETSEVGTNRNATDFIQVKPNTSYLLSGVQNSGVTNSNKQFYVAQYDANKEIIVVTAPSVSSDYVKITTEAKTKYIRTTIKDDDLDRCQIEQSTQTTPHEPYKSNILTTSEEVELRGVAEVEDELNLLTGELTQRVGEVVLNGSENWTLVYNTNDVRYNIYSMVLSDVDTTINNSFLNCLSDKAKTDKWSNINVNFTDKTFGLLSNRQLRVQFNGTLEELRMWLSETQPTIQYLKQKSIKTVDLMPSGTHPSTTPYCWKNGHIQLSSSGLLPNLEYSVVTSRAGQINQNATMIVKNDKRIFDLEILLAGGLVNTTYQALTLQNQVETGLSKVSLSSETEPDYLLYHMIMKLIEEKAYKLDDLTEKVSVFYLYEKLSDEQFETIYSALYPFAEDEIIEEPVVEELPEVVEDEVIM